MRIMEVKNILQNKFTCVIVCNSKRVYSSEQSGIRPLISAFDSGIDMRGGIAYDKIVGKAAAFIYVALGVAEVHAEVMSVTGQEVLKKHGIVATAEVITEQIVNRQGTGICPMEQAVSNVSSVEQAVNALRSAIVNMQSKN